jgi:iron complex outermembrane recepter protein
MNEGIAKRWKAVSIWRSTIMATSALIPAMAMAQQTPAPPADTPPAGDSADLGVIVVTATHKSESVQKVPISIQALGNETLANHQVAEFADYVNMLPSVSFSSLGPGRTNLFFRGISVSGGQLPTVGVYLDDVPITTASRMPEVHVYDIERVEALSGPQGTLFGSSSLAGTMRIITNKAKIGVFEGGYEVEANKYGDGAAGDMFQGYLNIPLTKNLAVRLMGFYEHDGGYIDNKPATYSYQSVPITINNAAIAKNNYNPVWTYGGRATATWEPAPDWTVTPEFVYQYLDAQGSFNYDPRVGDLAVHDFNPTYDIDKWYQAATTIHGKIADFDVVSSTGYFFRKIRNANDYTYYSVTYDKLAAKNPASYLSYLDFKDKNGNNINPTQQYMGLITQRKFTQEVRVTTPKSWPFDATFGGFYQYQKNETTGAYYISGLSQATNLSGYSPALGSEASPDAFYLVETDQHYKDGAAFAEANYNILHNLKLTGGIRYFVSDNGTYGFSGIWGSAKKATSLVDGGSCIQNNEFIHPYRLSCINTNIPYHQTGQTHRISATWQVTPDKMLYTTYSTGFRPGGGNRLSGSAPYEADTLVNFEIGAKTMWGRNLRLNIAAYHELWKGIQYSVIPQGDNGAGVTINAGNAIVKGIEGDFTYRMDKFTLSGSGAYNDARLSTNFCNLASRTDLTQLATCSDLATDMAAAKGTRLPRQPLFKTNVTLRYETPVGKYTWYTQASMLHQSSSTSDLSVSNDQLLGDTPGFYSFDFAQGIKRDTWSVELFIQNAFDNRGELSKNTFCSIQYCSGSSRTYPIKPQFFGLKFSNHF